MDVRINHKNMTRGQKTAFVEAVLALKNKVDSVLNPGRQSRYDDFVAVHRAAMGGPGAFEPMPHRSPLFFPWHRVFLRQFELALQAAVNDKSITLPFWDWTLNGPNDPFTPNFLGGNGDKAQNYNVTSGPFAFVQGNFRVTVWDMPLGFPELRRDFGEEAGSRLPSADDVMSALTKVPYSHGPDSWENFVEGVLHDPVHRWVGGNMWFPSSPNDPVFFLHHCHLDLLWERWKLQHPTIEPYMPVSGRPGFDAESGLVFSAPGAPVPWAGSWKVKEVISTESLDYTYGMFTPPKANCVPLPPVCTSP